MGKFDSFMICKTRLADHSLIMDTLQRSIPLASFRSVVRHGQQGSRGLCRHVSIFLYQVQLEQPPNFFQACRGRWSSGVREHRLAAAMKN